MNETDPYLTKPAACCADVEQSCESRILRRNSKRQGFTPFTVVLMDHLGFNFRENVIDTYDINIGRSLLKHVVTLFENPS